MKNNRIFILLGEGMTLVKATSKVDASTVFLADGGKKVLNMFLQPNESVCINGEGNFQNIAKL